MTCTEDRSRSIAKTKDLNLVDYETLVVEVTVFLSRALITKI